VSDYPGYQLLPNAEVGEADIIFHPIAYGASVSNRPGTADAPRAILEATAQLEYYEEDLAWSPMKHLWPAVLPELSPEANETAPDFFKRVFNATLQLPQDALYIGLGGDHSITPDQVMARMDQGTVIVLDAHSDLRPHYRGDPWSHACPVWRLHDAGYSIILIGIRSLFETEAELIHTSSDIQAWFDRKLKAPDTWQELLTTLDKISGPVWLSVDMDGFDPALVPSVGTPQPGGLNWHQAMDIVEHLIGNTNIDLRGVDLLELIPEENQVSQTVAAKLIQKIISYWGFHRVQDKLNPAGAQLQIDYS
jgi:agmatinase